MPKKSDGRWTAAPATPPADVTSVGRRPRFRALSWLRPAGPEPRAAGRTGVLRTICGFLAPRWLGLHVLVLAAVVTMVLLGRWQLRVSNDKHFDLQNFGYTLQWWAFSLAALFFWGRLIRDALRPPPSTTAGGQVALRTGPTALRDGAAYAGPADLVAPAERPGEAPVVYRGYVIPESRSTPHRSYSDSHHDAYNDYLWQLGLADSAGEDHRSGHRPADSAATEATPAEHQLAHRRALEGGPEDPVASSD